MAIIGLGTDIVEIKRIEKALERNPVSFAKHILNSNELEQLGKIKFKAKFLAKRFAVKEAASKALGTGIAKGISFHDFDITHNNLGKPQLHFSGMALKKADTLCVKQIHVTISDEHSYAVATVILEN